jgi:predicted dehydrogenase
VTALPSPRVPDPAEAPTLRWGILAPGGIARTFAEALRGRTRQHLQAVASRSPARARAFADTWGVTTVHDSYAALVADPDVDVVYVASPHSEHHAQALLAIGAGKPVLVEKAFARNLREATEVVEAARSAGVFAMEAMWTKHLPHIDVVRRCLEEDVLGEVVSVAADHGQPLWPNGPQRLSDPALAGGAMLDLGVYPMSFAHLVLGGFSSVTASGTLTDEGVDASVGVVVRNAGGAVGLLGTTMAARTPTTATVCGTRGRLEIDGDFYAAGATVRLHDADGREVGSYRSQETEHGLHRQAAEAARCISAGLLESPVVPLADTLAIMAAMDDARAQVGVRYPGE